MLEKEKLNLGREVANLKMQDEKQRKEIYTLQYELVNVEPLYIVYDNYPENSIDNRPIAYRTRKGLNENTYSQYMPKTGK